MLNSDDRIIRAFNWKLIYLLTVLFRYYNAGERPTIEILHKQPELIHRVRWRFGVHMLMQELYDSMEWPDWRQQQDTIHLLINHRSYLDPHFKEYVSIFICPSYFIIFCIVGIPISTREIFNTIRTCLDSWHVSFCLAGHQHRRRHNSFAIPHPWKEIRSLVIANRIGHLILPTIEHFTYYLRYYIYYSCTSLQMFISMLSPSKCKKKTKQTTSFVM